MLIQEIVERIRREPPIPNPDGLFPENPAVCTVIDPMPWDRSKVERALGFEVPPAIATLWDCCGGLRLYEDNLWCPGGLIVLSPLEALEQHFEYLGGYRGEDAIRGDFAFGRFRENLELLLIRCDKAAADYGSILVVAEMEPRPDWDKAADSLEEFLTRYMDARGEKYWEYHYRKKMAERAAEELLRARRVN